MADDLGALVAKLQADVSDLKKGLRESREDLRSFKDMAQDAGAKVKQALSFVGVAVGIYEIASALKSFAKDAAMVGARTETLNIAMQQVGKTYGVSAASLKFYVDELKAAGITSQESMLAVTKALTTGIPLDQLKDLATRARDIAVVAGINTSEALNRMMQGIITGEQETLRRLMIQVGSTDEIYKRFAATLGKTKEQLNSVEKAQAMVNEVLRLTAGFAGTAAAADESVGKQLQSMARFAEEAKNALWALFSPVMTAAVQEMTQGWKDLKTWADANQVALKAWGSTIGSWINSLAQAIKATVDFIREHQTLITTVLEIAIFAKASGWVIGFGQSLAGVMPKIAAATLAITGLKIACSGPWSIAITVAIGGVLYGINKIREMHNELAALQKNAGVSGRGPISKPGDTFQVKQVPGISARGVLSPELQAKLQEEEAVAQKARQDAKKAQDKASADAPAVLGKGGGGKGGGKEAVDNLLAPMQALYKAQRDAALQHHQNLFDLLKSGNDKERAELERKLAAQLIDGETYYQSLQDLQQKETDAALAMIEEKKQAQQKAYQESLAALADDTKLSDEAKSIARQKLEVENKKSLAKLDTEGKQAELEGAKKVTDELKRQVEVRKQYQQKTEDLNLETRQLLGAITEQETKLQRLVLDWQQAKEEAIKAGAGPEYLTALDANLGAKKFDVKYGETLNSISSEFSSGLTNIINGIRQGTFDISNALIEMFNNIMMAALKPGFDALGAALSGAIRWLLNSLSQAMGGGGFSFAGASGGGGDYGYLTGMVQSLKVPGLAGGGIAYKPTLAMIAEAGEAEVVSPLSDLKNLLNSQSVTVIVNNNAPRTQASAESQPNGDVVVTIDELVGKAYARRGTLYKLINQGDKATRR